MAQLAIGVDLGGTYIKLALVRRDNGIVEQIKVPTGADDGPDHVMQQITRGIGELLNLVPADSDVSGIGVGSPGTISLDLTTIYSPPNFPGWDVINLAETLPRLLGRQFKVVVDNDANAAGLGSAFYGAGKRHDSFIMVTLGTGVGGAIIHQNRIFRGAGGGAGEIGHVSIDYEGPRPRSGVPGAIEAYLGQRFLSRHARYYLMNRKESVVHQMAGKDLKGITPHILHDAALAGDSGAIEILAWAGHKLGCVLGSIINLLDIRVVIVGGGVSQAGDFIFEPAREAMRAFVMPALQDGLLLKQESRGNDVGVLGAAHLIFQATD